jgi:hypothetical protein
LRKEYSTDTDEKYAGMKINDYIVMKIMDAEDCAVEGQEKGWFHKQTITEEEAVKRSYPVQIGSLIYTYARMKMNEVIKYGVHYMDTDSALMEYSDYLRFIEDNPDAMGTEFGQFDHDKGMWDTKNDCPVIAGFTLLAPKCYFIYDDKGNIIKKGFKGIRIKSEKSDYCDKLIG